MRHRHICECSNRYCTARFTMTHRQYLDMTEAGQQIVAAGHVNGRTHRVVEVVGDAVVVERHRVAF